MDNALMRYHYGYSPSGVYDDPRAAAGVDAASLANMPGSVAGTLADPFLRALAFSQRAADAGGFSNLPQDDVGRETALMGASMMGGGMLAGGRAGGAAVGQNASSPELAGVIRDLVTRGAMPGAAAGGAYSAVDGGDVRDGMMGGALFGTLGRGAWNIADDIHSKGFKWPGSTQGGPRGPTAGQQASAGGQGPQVQNSGSLQNSAIDYPSYNSLPQQAKQNNREVYVGARALNGGDLPATSTARDMRSAYQQRGVNVPITPARVKNTNDSVNEFVRANGRQPASKDDWAQIFNKRTLAVPVAAGSSQAGSFDDALNAYKSMVLDIDGDGVPDIY